MPRAPPVMIATRRMDLSSTLETPDPSQEVAHSGVLAACVLAQSSADLFPQPVVHQLRRDEIVHLRRNAVRVAADAARLEPDVLVGDARLREILRRAVVVR